MFNTDQIGISLFIIAGAVMVIIGATRLYRNRKNKGEGKKK